MPTFKEYATPYQEVTYAPASKVKHGWHQVEQSIIDRWSGLHHHSPTIRWEVVTPYTIFLYDPYDAKTKFEILKQQWFEEIMFTSDPLEIVSNRHYKEIVDLGYSVVPFLLQDMKLNHSHWFTALRLIIGANPIKKEHFGDIPKMVDDWLDWSKNNLSIE